MMLSEYNASATSNCLGRNVHVGTCPLMTPHNADKTTQQSVALPIFHLLKKCICFTSSSTTKSQQRKIMQLDIWFHVSNVPRLIPSQTMWKWSNISDRFNTTWWQTVDWSNTNNRLNTQPGGRTVNWSNTSERFNTTWWQTVNWSNTSERFNTQHSGRTVNWTCGTYCSIIICRLSKSVCSRIETLQARSCEHIMDTPGNSPQRMGQRSLPL